MEKIKCFLSELIACTHEHTHTPKSTLRVKDLVLVRWRRGDNWIWIWRKLFSEEFYFSESKNLARISWSLGLFPGLKYPKIYLILWPILSVFLPVFSPPLRGKSPSRRNSPTLWICEPGGNRLLLGIGSRLKPDCSPPEHPHSWATVHFHRPTLCVYLPVHPHPQQWPTWVPWAVAIPLTLPVFLAVGILLCVL